MNRNFDVGVNEDDFISDLAHGVLKHQAQIDEIIIKKKRGKRTPPMAPPSTPMMKQIHYF